MYFTLVNLYTTSLNQCTMSLNQCTMSLNRNNNWIKPLSCILQKHLSIIWQQVQEVRIFSRLNLFSRIINQSKTFPTRCFWWLDIFKLVYTLKPLLTTLASMFKLVKCLRSLSLFLSFHSSLSLPTSPALSFFICQTGCTYTYVYVPMYVWVCVCVCTRMRMCTSISQAYIGV